MSLSFLEKCLKYFYDVHHFLQTFATRMYGSFAFMIPIFVAMSTFGGVNGILLTSSRLFYAGAVEGQMPEVLSMIQVNKMTPAPAVLIVVRKKIPLCNITMKNLYQTIFFKKIHFISKK